MAAATVHALLQKALADPVFRQSLGTNLDGTLNMHHVALEPHELTELKKVDWHNLVTPTSAAANSWIHVYSSIAPSMKATTEF